MDYLPTLCVSSLVGARAPSRVSCTLATRARAPNFLYEIRNNSKPNRARPLAYDALNCMTSFQRGTLFTSGQNGAGLDTIRVMTKSCGW